MLEIGRRCVQGSMLESDIGVLVVDMIGGVVC